MLRFARRAPALNSSIVARLVALVIALVIILSGCATRRNSVEWSEEDREILRLDQLLRLTRDELSRQESLNSELRSEVTELEARVAELEMEIQTLAVEATATTTNRDEEIEALRAEREALLLDLERLSNAAEVAAAQAAEAEEEAAEARALEGTSEAAEESAREALREALDGLGGFRRISTLGPQSDERLAARLAVSGSGLSVDSSDEDPVLYDSSLNFDTSLVYLTIVDPESPAPTLVLTVQYVSDIRPLYAQTAFIGIEGSDPVDPVDPIIFTGSPQRETDGVRVREAFSREVDRRLLRRLSAMLSASGFSSTFVGSVGRASFRPTATEREAMSRVLFAFIDLGGFRQDPVSPQES